MYAVMGSPIQHSLSPQIHQQFAEQFDIELDYKKILVPSENLPAKALSIEGLSENLAKALKSFHVQGGLGVNLTSPLKEIMFSQLDLANLTDRARHAQAVNTLSFKANQLLGDNTDGIGFIRDLTINNNTEVKDKRILILGAGGATRGILRPLLTVGPRVVTIASRTKPKALSIQQYFRPWGKIKVVSYLDLKKNNFDVIINATNCGLQNELPPFSSNFKPLNSYCYDLNYNAAAKPFLHWAKVNGASMAVDGLGMLIEQAAEAFYIWHNRRPNIGVVKRNLIKLEDLV